MNAAVYVCGPVLAMPRLGHVVTVFAVVTVYRFTVG